MHHQVLCKTVIGWSLAKLFLFLLNVPTQYNFHHVSTSYYILMFLYFCPNAAGPNDDADQWWSVQLALQPKWQNCHCLLKRSMWAFSDLPSLSLRFGQRQLLLRSGEIWQSWLKETNIDRRWNAKNGQSGQHHATSAIASERQQSYSQPQKVSGQHTYCYYILNNVHGSKRMLACQNGMVG